MSNIPLVTIKIWLVINHEGVNGVKGEGGFDLTMLLGLLVVVKWFQLNWINYFNGCLAKRWDVLQCVKSTHCYQLRHTSMIIILGGRCLSCNFIGTTIWCLQCSIFMPMKGNPRNPLKVKIVDSINDSIVWL
jgi:hypothetical protein